VFYRLCEQFLAAWCVARNPRCVRAIAILKSTGVGINKNRPRLVAQGHIGVADPAVSSSVILRSSLEQDVGNSLRVLSRCFSASLSICRASPHLETSSLVTVITWKKRFASLLRCRFSECHFIIFFRLMNPFRDAGTRRRLGLWVRSSCSPIACIVVVGG